jgi:hypothetical protein
MVRTNKKSIQKDIRKGLKVLVYVLWTTGVFLGVSYGIGVIEINSPENVQLWLSSTQVMEFLFSETVHSLNLIQTSNAKVE